MRYERIRYNGKTVYAIIKEEGKHAIIFETCDKQGNLKFRRLKSGACSVIQELVSKDCITKRTVLKMDEKYFALVPA